MSEPVVPEEQRRLTVVEYLELIRERNVCVPVALIANSAGGSDPARFIPLEPLNIVIGECAKVVALEARVAELQAELAAAKKTKRAAARKPAAQQPAVFKAPAKKRTR